jgi:hypothetical protein
MSEPHQIGPGGCTKPSFPLDPGPRRPGEALRALRDRIARQRSEPTTEKEHLARRIRRALGRLLRPSSTSG